MVYDLVSPSNIILSCFFFFFLIFYLYRLICSISVQIFNPTAELKNTQEVKGEIEIYITNLE